MSSDTSKAPDGDRPTLHLRCGSDLRDGLRNAGFAGAFLEFADPYCQGPVCAGPDFHALRARFLADAYGLDLTDVRTRQRREYDALGRAAETERVVLWFEHDSFDQLILARVLHGFANGVCPETLELICIDSFPGIQRFIGLGQLGPAELRSLWPSRELVGVDQLELGSAVWLALTEPSPVALHSIAAAGTPSLSPMASALHRHLQELPWTTDGLSLTQRLALETLRDGPCTAGALFRTLTLKTEPLPFLGDLMFWHVLDDLAAVAHPPFEACAENVREPRQHRRLALTPTGEALLDARLDWLSLDPRPRWIGGVCARPGSPVWRWSPSESRPVES